MHLAFATGNPHKFQEVQHLLGNQVELEQIELDLPEVQAIEVEKVVEAKARVAFAETQQPVLIEDTGLYFEAWHGLPGALIKWHLETVGDAGLCQMLSSFDNRQAKAKTVFGFFDGQTFQSFEGETTGQIVDQPRGSDGFGWDTLFQPTDSDKTFAEMTASEKSEFSMRRKALEQFTKTS